MGAGRIGPAPGEKTTPDAVSRQTAVSTRKSSVYGPDDAVYNKKPRAERAQYVYTAYARGGRAAGGPVRLFYLNVRETLIKWISEVLGFFVWQGANLF